MNTFITYLYRDASNYKQSGSFIVTGDITFSDIEQYLDEGIYFIPGQVGMDHLQPLFGKLSEDDHPWHELEADDFESTQDLPTVDFTAQELIERFQQVTWNENREAENNHE